MVSCNQSNNNTLAANTTSDQVVHQVQEVALTMFLIIKMWNPDFLSEMENYIYFIRMFSSSTCILSLWTPFFLILSEK